MIVLYFIGFVALCALGGWFARMDGGGKPVTPEIVERLLCISPFVAAVVPYAGWWSVLALAGMVGLATGHGQYFMSLAVKYIKAEFVDPIVRLFFGPDPRTVDYPNMERAILDYGGRRLLWRCAFGMFVTGTLVGLPAAIIAASFGHWAGAVLLASTGIVKALAYYAFRPDTMPAEWCNGSFRTALALSALVLAL